jgi:hypothetical protein
VHKPELSAITRANTALDPWRLVWGEPYIDSRTLAAAIEQDLERSPRPDFRTRLLVRDAALAIQSYWGSRRFTQWLASSPMGPRIRAILDEDLGRPGFSTIRRRLVDSIDSTQLSQMFELLGRGIHDRIEVHIAGSIPTLLKGLTVRPTTDIDFVDEVPAEVRRQRDVLKRIETEFGLKLAHMQSHFLPDHWQDRRHWFGDFGGLRVYVVDEYDVFVSKLSSKQEKHQSDLRVLALKLNKDQAKHRLLTDGQAFLEDRKLRPQIEENWRFIFQEPLVPDEAGRQKRQGPSSSRPQKPSPPRHGRGKRRGPRMSTDR